MRRPGDECPYPKPFVADFDDCPAFQARQFIPLDTLYQPLEPVLTCRHLETRAMPERHRWYGGCALGDADARRRWARQVGVARLEKIRAVQAQLGRASAPYSQRLWALKGQQLRAVHDNADPEPATAELRELAENMTRDLLAFVAMHPRIFAEIDMPIDATSQLIQIAMDRFIEPRFTTEVSFEVPEDILRRFPAPVQTFFQPGQPERPAAQR
jgi:hypothetical protein